MNEQQPACQGNELSTQTVSPAGPPRRKRRVRCIVLLLVLAFAAWFARFAYLRITVRPAPRPEYWEAQIEALDPPPAGGLTVEQAAEILSDHPWLDLPEVQAGLGSRTKWNSVLTGPWDETRPDIVSARFAFGTKSFDETSDRVRDALRVGWSPFIQTTSLRMLANWFREFWVWSTWFNMHARWARESGVGMDEAVVDWLDALRLGREARRPCLVIAQGAAAHHDDQVAWEMLVCAREPHDRVDTLRLAQAVEEIVGPPVPPCEMFEGERLYLHSHLERIYAGGGHDWLVVSEAAKHPASWDWGPIGPAASRLWNLTSPVFLDLPSARRIVDAYFARLNRIRSFAECVQTSDISRPDDREARPTSLIGVTYSFSSRGPENTLLFCFHARMSLDAAVTMLALDEYRREQERYPERLEELIPRFLLRLPTDYADLQPLRYRRLRDDYLLYSIGEDLKDDDGIGKSPYDYWPSYGGSPPRGDIVFSLSQRPPLKSEE